VLHGAAWGIAWGAQLWAPARRSQQGSSPLRAAAGYAGLTIVFGLAVERFGPDGLAALHAALAVAATAALVVGRLAARARPAPQTPAA
jgi:hypothetical protein